MTHYGDFNYNVYLFSSTGEPGVDFETGVFGTFIDYPQGIVVV